jgi:hypothetical protein
MSSNTTKRTANLGESNVIRAAFNESDSSLQINGFLAGKKGHKVTLQLETPTSEVFRFYDITASISMDISGTNVSNIPAISLQNLEIGTHILTSHLDYDVTIASIDKVAKTAVLSAAADISGVAVPCKVGNLLLKYKLIYDNSSKDNLLDAENITE